MGLSGKIKGEWVVPSCNVPGMEPWFCAAIHRTEVCGAFQPHPHTSNCMEKSGELSMGFGPVNINTNINLLILIMFFHWEMPQRSTQELLLQSPPCS